MSPFFYALMWFSFGALLMRSLVLWTRVAPLERQIVTLKETIALYEAIRIKKDRDAGLSPDLTVIS